MDALPAFCPLPTRCDYLPRPNWEHLADLFAISTQRPRALLCALTAGFVWPCVMPPSEAPRLFHNPQDFEP